MAKRGERLCTCPKVRNLTRTQHDPKCDRFRSATCHPERQFVAKGLCDPCYQTAIRRIPGRTREAQNKANAASRLRTRYGIEPEQYNQMLVEQGGACKLCFGPNTAGRKLAVDHDHVTGKVRSLLCTRCNILVGYVENTPELLERAVAYLAAHGNGKKGN